MEYNRHIENQICKLKEYMRNKAPYTYNGIIEVYKEHIIITLLGSIFNTLDVHPDDIANDLQKYFKATVKDGILLTKVCPDKVNYHAEWILNKDQFHNLSWNDHGYTIVNNFDEQDLFDILVTIKPPDDIKNTITALQNNPCFYNWTIDNPYLMVYNNTIRSRLKGKKDTHLKLKTIKKRLEAIACGTTAKCDATGYNNTKTFTIDWYHSIKE